MDTGGGQTTGRASSSIHGNESHGTRPMQPDSHSQSDTRGSRTTQEVSQRHPDMRPWEEEEDAYIRAVLHRAARQERNGPLPVHTMATFLGRQVHAVETRVQRLDEGRVTHCCHRKRRWTREEVQMLEQMLANEVDLAVIGIRLHKSRGSIRATISRLAEVDPTPGLLRRYAQYRRYWSAEEDQRLEKMVAEGVSLATQAERLRRSEGSVISRRRRIQARCRVAAA